MLEMKYFVLKPKGNDPHAHASRVAMHAYANAIKLYDLRLSEQLILWAEIEYQRKKNEND